MRTWVTIFLSPSGSYPVEGAPGTGILPVLDRDQQVRWGARTFLVLEALHDLDQRRTFVRCEDCPASRKFDTSARRPTEGGST